MTKVMWRTRQKYQKSPDNAADGVMAVPTGLTSTTAARFSGTDGEVFNTTTGTTEDDRDKLAIPSITGSAHGGFAAADVGRMIKLTNTTPTAGTSGTKKADNWVFRISAVISTTVVRLEGARFEDASTVGAGTVNWTLMACSQFSAASANFSSDPVAGNGGNAVDKHITLPNPPSATPQLKYLPWRVGKVIDSTNLLVNDWTGNIDSFPTGSTLAWYLGDRQAYTYQDLYMMMARFMIACGHGLKGVRATGSVQAVAAPTTGHYVSIWDGAARKVFEWTNGAPGANHIAVAFTGSAVTNASNLATAINGVGNLTAVVDGVDNTKVNITNTLYDAKGNTNIFVSNAGSYGSITGMSGGMTPGQFRGRNNGFTTAAGLVNDGIVQDLIFFSNGENDPANPKRYWTRLTAYNNNAVGNGIANGSGYGISFALWQGWDPAFANAATHNKGNGINPMKSAGDTQTSITYGASDAVQAISSTGPCFSPASGNSSAWITAANYAEGATNPYGIFGGEQITLDYVFFGDKDEFHFFVMDESIGASYQGMGCIQEVNQNAQRFMVRAAATAGSNVVINVGANLDPQGVTAPRGADTQIAVPYQANDELQAAGLAVNASAPTGGQFIESDQITTFGTVAASATNPDGLDYSITVATLNKTLAIGDILGEEAMPMFAYGGPHTATFGAISQNAVRFQNQAQHGDATFFDWNGHTGGATATDDGFSGIEGLGTLGSNALTEVDPNHRGGRWGVVPVVFRDTTEGQFRGRMRYYFLVSPRLGTWQWVPDRNGNWYFIVPYVLRQQNTQKIAFGPLSATLAKPF